VRAGPETAPNLDSQLVFFNDQTQYFKVRREYTRSSSTARRFGRVRAESADFTQQQVTGVLGALLGLTARVNPGDTLVVDPVAGATTQAAPPARRWALQRR
jgi:hypothetical protein